MNLEVFKNWFINMLNHLEEPSVIVKDNAFYHSQLKDNFPKSNSRKAVVEEWLKNKNIEFSPLERLSKLRERVKKLIPMYKRYELDEIALEMDHEVIRLPPYHCQYNPIELILAKVKGEVAKNNNTFKIADAEKLAHAAMDAVKQEDWEKCVAHAEKIQNQDNEKEILRDVMLEPIIIIITLRDDDSDWSVEHDDDDDVFDADI
jgi:transposase